MLTEERLAQYVAQSDNLKEGKAEPVVYPDLNQTSAISKLFPPDQFAKAKLLSKRSGVPLPAALDQADHLSIQEQQLRLQKINKLIRPAMADPNFGPLAVDDTDSLEKIATAFDDIKKGFKAGRLQEERSQLDFQAKSGLLDQQDINRRTEISNALPGLQGSDGLLEASSSVLGGLFESTKKAAPDIIEYGGYGAMAGGALSAAAGPLAPLAFVPATVGGFAAGAVMSMAKASYKSLAGESYGGLLEAGVDEETAQIASTGVGAISAALDMIGLSAVASPFKKALMGRIGKDVAERLATDGTLKTTIGGLKAYGTTVGGEVVTETAQQLVQITGEDLARRYGKNELEGLFGQEDEFGNNKVYSELVDTAVQTAKAMALLGISGAGVSVASDMSKAKQAKAREKALNAAIEDVKASKVLQRSPEDMANFIDSLSPEAKIDTIQFQQLYQKDDIDPAIIAQRLGAGDSYSESLQTGGDITISTGKLAAQAAADPEIAKLIQHVKFNDDEVSAVEANDVSIESFIDDSEGLKVELEKEQAEEKSFNAVRDKVRDGLVATNKYTFTQAQTQAELVGAFYRTLGQKLRVTTEQAFKRFPVEIGGGIDVNLGDQVLNKKTTDTPEFKSWFGDSKVVDENDKPLVVYHGTNQNFTSFSKEKLGFSTGAESAKKGFFFTNSAEIAGQYSELYYPTNSMIGKYTGKIPDLSEIKNVIENFNLDTLQVDILKKIYSDLEKGGDFKDLMGKNGSDYIAQFFDGSLDIIDLGQSANILPVYLSIKNPLIHDFKGNAYRDETYSDLLKEAKLKGHDGVIFKNTFDNPFNKEDLQAHDIYALFEPEQIKSAIGNRGTFDPEDSSILNQGNNAAISFENFPIDPAKITIFENANLTSFLHEAGHLFFETYTKLYGQNEAITKDVDTLVSWFGLKSFEEYQALDFEGRRKHHEAVAEAFETYLMNGKAPTPELQSLFQTLMTYFISVYKALRNRPFSLNDDVRMVFDRMLATEDEINRGGFDLGFNEMMKSAEDMGGSKADFEKYQALSKKGKEEARQSAIQKTSKDMYQVILADKKDVTEKHRGEVYAMPWAKAWHYLKKGAEYGEAKPDGKPLKFSKKDLIDVYGSDKDALWKKLPRSFIVDDYQPYKVDPKNIDPVMDSMFDALSKLGGIDTLDAKAHGIDAAAFKTKGFRNRLVFKKGGLKFSEAIERMREEGYIPADSESILLDAISRELSGDRVYTVYGLEKIAEENYRAQLQEALDAEVYDLGERMEPDYYYGEEGELSSDEKRIADLVSLADSYQDGEGQRILQKAAFEAAMGAEYTVIQQLKEFINEQKPNEGAKPGALEEAEVEKATPTSAQVLAERYGYSKGSDLINKIIENGNPDAEIKKRVEKELQDIYGEFHKEDKLTILSMNSWHNKSVSSMLALELKALTGLAKLPSITQDQAKAAAIRFISGQKIQKINPAQYLSTEKRSVKKAASAFKAYQKALKSTKETRQVSRFKADITQRPEDIDKAGLMTPDQEKKAQEALDTAITWKKKQLMNHYLYLESQRVLSISSRYAKYLNKFNKKKNRLKFGKAGKAYLDKINAIREAYGFKNFGPKTLAKISGLRDWVEEQKANGERVDLPDSVMTLADQTNYKELTVSEFQAVYESVKNLEHVALNKNRLSDAAKLRDLNSAAEVIGKQLYEQSKTFGVLPDDGNFVKKAVENGFSEFIAGVIHEDALITSHLDGGKALGPSYEILKSPIDKATHEVLFPMRKKLEQMQADIFQKYFTRAELKSLRKKLVQIELSDGRGGKKIRELSKSRLLAVYLNTGNKGNIDAVINGKVSGVQEYTSEDIDAIRGALTDKELEFGQAVWDMLDFEMWPLVKEKQEKRLGFAPSKIDALPFTVRGKVYRGGYFPLKYDQDSLISTTYSDIMEAERAALGGSASAQTKRAHTKERVGSGGKRINYDLSTLTSHLKNVTYDLAMGDVINDTWKILKHKQTVKSFVDTGNSWLHKSLTLWVKELAVGEVLRNEWHQKLFRLSRSGMSAVHMGYNAGVVIIQALGLLPAIPVIGAGNLMHGLTAVLNAGGKGKIFAQKDSIQEFVRSQSPFMSSRATAFNEQFGQLQSDLSGGSPFELARKHMYTAIGWLQGLVDSAIWIGAMRKHKDLPLEKRIAMADNSVRTTQGSNIFQDRSAFERGTAGGSLRQNEFVKMFTVMAGPMFRQTSNLYILGRQADIKNPRDLVALVSMVFYTFALPAMLISLARGTYPEDEDDSWAWWAAGGTISAMAGGLPIVRDFSSEAEGFRGGPSYGNLLDKGGQSIKQIRQVVDAAYDGKDASEALDMPLFKSINNLFGSILRLPTGQLNRVIESSVEDINGEDVDAIEYLMWRKDRKDD